MIPELVRRVVREWAIAIEETLRVNDWKQSWETMTLQDTEDLLDAEYWELKAEFAKAKAEPLIDNGFRIGLEARDVGTVCLMIWDRFRGPLASRNRGRA